MWINYIDFRNTNISQSFLAMLRKAKKPIKILDKMKACQQKLLRGIQKLRCQDFEVLWFKILATRGI